MQTSVLNERNESYEKLEQQNEKCHAETTDLNSQLEKKNDEVMELSKQLRQSRQGAARSHQSHADLGQTSDSKAAGNLSLNETDTNVSQSLYSIVDKLSIHIGKWHNDWTGSEVTNKTQQIREEMQAFANEPWRLAESNPAEASQQQANVQETDDPDDVAISAATMEVYTKLVRRLKLRNKAVVQGCITICGKFNVDTRKLNLWLEKPEREQSQDPSIEELISEESKLKSEQNIVMQNTRALLKNAGIQENDLKAVANDPDDSVLCYAIEIILSKWQQGTSKHARATPNWLKRSGPRGSSSAASEIADMESMQSEEPSTTGVTLGSELGPHYERGGEY